ncbi:MAG: ROK family protein [Halobacteriales archaeon]
MEPIAGVDLGATNLRIAVADGAGDLLASERASTPQDSDGAAVAQAIAETLDATADRAGVAVSSLTAVGIGTIGPLDRDAGEVVHPPNLDGVDRIPLRDGLIPLIGHPRVYVENDAVAGLVGERAARDDPAENLVYLTISTGIGAGVVVDGHVLRGRAGNAAEVGHFVVEPDDGRRCGCGATGHWEAYCSGGGLPGFTRELAERTGLETDLPVDADFDAATVFAAAGDDPLADRVLQAMTRYNAAGLADLVHAYAPDRIAIGGAVALRNQARVIEPLSDAVGEHTMLAVPEITPAAHGEDAVLTGALTLAADGGL